MRGPRKTRGRPKRRQRRDNDKMTETAQEGKKDQGRGWAKEVLTVQVGPNEAQCLVITFSEKDMRYAPPRRDEPMVVSVIIAEYKVERVLINQEMSSLKECLGTLYGFIDEQVIELETTFETGSHAQSIPVLYTMVDTWDSYNVIMGRLALNKLGVVVSILHLCIKYLVGKEVGIVLTDQGITCKCYEDGTPTLQGRRVGRQSPRFRSRPMTSTQRSKTTPNRKIERGLNRPLGLPQDENRDDSRKRRGEPPHFSSPKINMSSPGPWLTCRVLIKISYAIACP
ncbi:hypothetical protein CR513_43942, partial [Mucuna pruriens]